MMFDVYGNPIKSRMEQILDARQDTISKTCIHPEMDYPADVPEFCGHWNCQACSGIIEKDGSGHKPECGFIGLGPHPSDPYYNKV